MNALAPVLYLIEQFRDPVVWTGLTQVFVASLLAVVVVGISRYRELALERELGIALVRGLIQIVAMGSIVGILLTVDLVWSGVILIGMMGGATWISKNRGEGLPGVVRVSFLAIVFGSGLVIITMTLAGAIEASVRKVHRASIISGTSSSTTDARYSTASCVSAMIAFSA